MVQDVLLVTGIVAGGIGRHVAGLASGLVGEGLAVRVACPPVVAARFDLAGTGATVVPVEIGSTPGPRRDRAAVAELRAVLGDAEVVHAHGLRAGGLSVLARGDDPGPPIVVTNHNTAPEGRLAAMVHRGLERLVCRRADVLLAVSTDLVERALDRGARRVGRAVVAASQAAPVRSPAEVRADLGIPQDHHLVVSIGRLAAQKGFDRLLDILADPVLRELPVRVVVAGDGPQRAQLERQAERDRLPVDFLGHRSDVADLLGAADVTVSAARWEGQPVWVQEALSVGAPIVATDVGGTAEVLEGAGVLVPADDPAAFAAALARVLTDAEHRKALRAGALARAAQLPTAADAVQAALTAYQRAVSRSTAPRDVD